MNQRAKVLKSVIVGEMLEADHFNYEDLRARCENYLESVRDQTREMLTQAQQKAEQVRLRAKEQGHQEGYLQGLKEAEQKNTQQLQQQAEQLAQKKLQTVLPLLQQASQEIGHERQACLSRWESQAVELVQAITEKIIHRSLPQDPEIVKERVEEVLKLTVGNSQIVIRIAEQDLESLEPYRESILATLSQQAQVKLVGEAGFTSGDIVVSTEHGEVDARIETQLERIAEELLGETPDH